jgi:hypothetical protein
MFEHTTYLDDNRDIGTLTIDSDGGPWFFSPNRYTQNSDKLEKTVEFINMWMSGDSVEIRKEFLDRFLDGTNINVGSVVTAEYPDIEYSVSLDENDVPLFVYMVNHTTGDVLVRDNGSWVDTTPETSDAFYAENAVILDYVTGLSFVDKYDKIGPVTLSEYYKKW